MKTVKSFLIWRARTHVKGQRPHRRVRVCFTSTSMVVARAQQQQRRWWCRRQALVFDMHTEALPLSL